MTQTQNTLHMKTYFATTVEAAVELARRELGSEAMLVNSRPAPEDVRHLGRYEVIFATGGPVAADAKPQPRVVEPLLPLKPTTRKPPATATAGDTHLQLEDIRLQLTTIRQSLWTSRPEAEVAPSDSSLHRRALEAGGVESSLARELVHAVVRQNPAPNGREQFRDALATEMERRLIAGPGFEISPSKDAASRTVLALVGPPGRGKSTTLVKIAIAHGLARRASVRILSLDNYRVGANEQMRCYGAILGVSYQSCNTIGELDYQLGNTWGADLQKAHLTLIDTSGYSPAELDDASDLAAYLSARPEIHVHLVLRADSKTADSVHAVQRFSHFGVSRVIFTGMDEVASYGSIYSSLVQSGLPVSFLGTGQRIPEDLEPAVASRIVRLVLEGKESSVYAAA
jgi:flagellar biosynthesis protein FlhF